MDKKHIFTKDQEKLHFLYSDRRMRAFDGHATHICRGFECQQEGKTNRSDKIERE